MIVCPCFIDALLYGRPISSDQSFADRGFYRENERPMWFVLVAKLVADQLPINCEVFNFCEDMLSQEIV
jgi:hypothetical protein